MKRKDIISLVAVGVIAAFFSWIITGAVFKSPSNRNTLVPTAQVISPTFPDVKNNPAYSSFLNNNAIDPTQTIQIGNSSNSAPFSGH